MCTVYVTPKAQQRNGCRFTFFWERRSALRLLTCFASADVKVRHAPGDDDGCKVGPHRKEPEGKMAEGSEGEETMEAWSGCLFGSVEPRMESQKVLPSSVLHPTIFPQPQLGATYPRCCYSLPLPSHSFFILSLSVSLGVLR